MKTLRPIALVLAAALSGTLAAQDKPRQIRIDDFEKEPEGWTALKLEAGGGGEDAESKVALAREGEHVKAGKGSLSYTFPVTAGTMRVLVLQRPTDLSGMKSLRLWVKSSHATAVVVGLAEPESATYQAAATVAAGRWQEISVNLDELVPDEVGKDPNGRLDLDRVGAIQVFDVGSFLVNLLPDLAATRTIWLDEIAFSSEAVPLTTGATKVTRVVPAFLVDNFESAVVRWSPISLEFGDPPRFSVYDVPVSLDPDAPPGGGKQSLRFAYPRRGVKVHGLLRSVEKNDLSRATALDLSLRTSIDGTFIVSLEEHDGSRYNKVVELKAADGWTTLNLALGDLTLADDSQDDNGRLDPGEIKQVAIADITQLAGGGEADENVLRIDQVLFVLAP